MTTRVERVTSVPVPPKRVWEFIADPEKRARSISVVVDFHSNDSDDRRAIWELKLPIPLVNRTVTVETEEIQRDPPKYVKFIGRSKIMRVIGEHKLEPTGEGTQVTNRFTVKGRIPGVEQYFNRNLENELDNFEDALLRDLGL
ncbi:MAG: SRPBCC family protein [Halobacteriaceae archaeon]